MVVLQRAELGRNRLIYFLTIVLSIGTLVTAVSLYSTSSEQMQLALVVLGLAGVVASVLSLIQLYAFPKRNHVLIVHRGDEMVIATNTLEEGFKLRFLRDILNDNVTAFSDDERARWKFLESDGYHPSLFIRNPRKILILRLCTMVFDDVFVVDRSDRWEHHDSANTADPTFSTPEMPPLKVWKGV